MIVAAVAASAKLKKAVAAHADKQEAVASMPDGPEKEEAQAEVAQEEAKVAEATEEAEALHTVVKAEKEAADEALKQEIEEVFVLVAAQQGGDDDSISKEELEKANTDEPDLFHRLDADQDGKVTSDEWHDYLQKRFKPAAAGVKGDDRIKDWLGRVKKNMGIKDTDTRADASSI